MEPNSSDWQSAFSDLIEETSALPFEGHRDSKSGDRGEHASAIILPLLC